MGDNKFGDFFFLAKNFSAWMCNGLKKIINYNIKTNEQFLTDYSMEKRFKV
jgi:hypothetical protein